MTVNRDSRLGENCGQPRSKIPMRHEVKHLSAYVDFALGDVSPPEGVEFDLGSGDECSGEPGNCPVRSLHRFALAHLAPSQIGHIGSLAGHQQRE